MIFMHLIFNKQRRIKAMAHCLQTLYQNIDD